MTPASLVLGDGKTRLECREVTGEERLGEPSRFEVELFSPEPVETADVLGKGAAILLATAHGERAIAGVITRWVAVATSQTRQGRKYKASFRSAVALLELRRRSRVYQHLSVPDIVKKLVGEGGYAADAITVSTREAHAPREYVVQYAETDASFLRRLCEDDGLFFRFEPADTGERFILEDTSSAAVDKLGTPLLVLDDSRQTAGGLAAYDCRASYRRRPGKVRLRDYDFRKPALDLEGIATAGTATEQKVEVYEAPGGFTTPAAGKARAKIRLESLRAEGSLITFRSNAVALAPGEKLALDPTAGYAGTARPEGDHACVAITHRWSIGDEEYAVGVEAIPIAVPYRLPRKAARPRVAGIHPAFVTGPAGQEIHTDADGRVHVLFPWDREGPNSDKSSLPIRVMQPNTPGSMAIPRIGWEVLVGFEDGDPDRPYVLGRTYNAKFPPPYALPANKTVTSLETLSSPGAGKMNSLRFDDAAGRQHIAINAAFAKTVTVSNNMVTQTSKNEDFGVKGSQHRTVGAKEDVSITQAFVNQLGSQSATVGGLQKIYVKGDQGVGVGSESVLVGGALLEKVGNPVTGAINLGVSAALSGVGALGRFGGVFGGLAATAASTAGGLAWGAYQGYKSGGSKGAWSALGQGALGVAAGLVPAGDAVLASVNGAASPPPYDEKTGAGGDAAGGGGAAGASDSSAAAGPGPGHRDTQVNGVMTELIGGALGIVTPGSIAWTTTGASTFLVAGGHSTRTATYGARTLGASSETLGSLSVTTKNMIARQVKGVLSTKIAGSLTSTATGVHVIEAGASMSIKIGGSLTMEGAHVVFICGSSVVAASPGGVLIEASTINISGSSKQSGGANHP
jgi:type VI secretion system secreted protein VgrG